MRWVRWSSAFVVLAVSIAGGVPLAHAAPDATASSDAAPSDSTSHSTSPNDGAASSAAASSSAAAPVVSVGGAAAVAPPRNLSPYEQGSLRAGLERLGTQVEMNPEGKRVESIEVVVLDVFEERDPAPQFLNWFHVNTDDAVVRREVLLRPGQPYRSLLAAESERNLRKFIQYSVVLVTPVKGTQPDTVRILVVTKDVWSLRLSWDPAFYQGHITSLLLSPSELNLFGSTQVVSGTISAGPNNVFLGLTYYVPRIAGSRISSSVSANAQVNCKTGDVEGGSGSFSYGKPLFSTRTAWSWGVNATYANQVGRVSPGAYAICSSPGAAGVRVALDPNIGSAPRQTAVAYIPNIYRAETMTGQIGATRSFFVRDKVNVSFGLETSRVRVAPYGTPTEIYVGESLFSQQASNRTCWPPTSECLADIPPSEAVRSEDLDPALVQWLYDQQRLPQGAFRVGPYVQLSAFKTNFVRLLNVNTLGLQEDFQFGHAVSLKVYPAVRPLASRNLLGTIASVDYTLPWSGGFYRLGASSTIEVSGNRDDYAKVGVARSSAADTRIEFRSYLASPSLGFGRFVMGTTLADHPQWRYNPTQFELGSADRLRGYPPGAFQGRTVFVNNLEFRTRPVEVFSTSLGLVAFWDVGRAADGLDALTTPIKGRQLAPGQLKTIIDELDGSTVANGVGFGLRVLLPQIDRQVFRIDLGFPVVGSWLQRYTLTAGFRQVFGDN